MPPVSPEFWHKDVTIKLNVITLMAVHGNLLLALRHPLNHGESRDLSINFVKQIGEELVLLGALAPEQLHGAYKVEAENGTPDLLEDTMTKPLDPKYSLEIYSLGISRESLEMLLRDAKCCACGNTRSTFPHLNPVPLNKKATWKNPVWDNPLLKPNCQRIPRAVAVLCDECINNRRLPIEVIEVEGTEIRYHKVSDLEDAFHITPDMVIKNIKELRRSHG